MFRLTKDETESVRLRSQIATSKNPDEHRLLEDSASLRSQIVTTNKRGGTRYLPYAFTELGVAMLSSVLISTAISELQAKDPKPKPRKRIGFVQEEEK